MESANSKQEEASSFLPSKLSRLATLGVSTNDAEIRRVEALLKRGSLVGFVVWVNLNVLLHALLAPASSYERLQGIERNANVLVMVLLLVTNGSRLIPLLFRGRSRVQTGAVIGSCTVQGIAISSVAIMVFFPTPVLVDPITKQRVLLARWAEWIPLAFLMTFLTEALDLAQQGLAAEMLAWKHGAAIALSTAAGLIFPFCQTLELWMITFIISCVLFMSLYIRLYQRHKRFRNTPRGTSVDEQERYERVRYSLRLLQACGVVWTLLVVAFTVCCFGQTTTVVASDHWLKDPALPVIIESIFEVASKIWYLNLLIDANDVIFDESSRAIRRLEELRYLMSVVWESSSDVIVLCVNGADTIRAVVSPTFLRLSHSDKQKNSKAEAIALVFEVSHDKKGSHRVIALKVSQPVTEADVGQQNDLLSQYIDPDPTSVDQRNIKSMAALIAKAWDLSSGKKDLVLMHELHHGKNEPMRCEAKMTRLETDAIVIVVRDISERFQLFEAEKRLVAEVTGRKKDIEANRFTRHEVKNGLLAAIGLAQSVRESWESRNEEQRDLTQSNMHRVSSNRSLNAEARSFEMGQGLAELELTLLEVLDTVMSEAMARDVVHEVYEPQKARINVKAILRGPRDLTSSSRERFPLVTKPRNFPEIMMDPQLLRHIQRNAVSNACKYGKEGGLVTTEIQYNADTREFRMDVVNLPGHNHDCLVQMSDDEKKTIFAAGTRLHEPAKAAIDDLDETLALTSSGDGAWIMQKCAKTLGGKCFIDFENDRTVFSLVCPVEVCTKSDLVPQQNHSKFKLPENVWGVAIDDSLVQRKLLGRFLSLLGIKSDRQKIMGQDANDVLRFTDKVKEIVQGSPEAKFILIVDENLEIQDCGVHRKTISGSLCVKLLREQMDSADEERVLALVRSANDSADDIKLYRSRAHGFLPKAPIHKDRVLEQIRPLWEERFPSDSLFQKSFSSLGSTTDSGDEGFHISPKDLMASVEVIDALCMDSPEEILASRWPAIREKLHVLKGDLKTMKMNSRIGTILEALDRFKGDSVPNDLVDRWTLLRSLIISIL
jgi:signal transduction histidine kinase